MEEANEKRLIGILVELFDDLKEVAGTDEAAADLWKSAFWFAFDGKNFPVIPDDSLPEFLGWINGAKMIVTALKDGGYFAR
jgi:hypothetical protein